jgi:dihydroneopterin aldolase
MSGTEGGAPRQDRLSLASIRCRVRIGVTEEERREPQRLEVDLELHADLGLAAASGDLARTIDYRQVCDLVRGTLEGREFRLVEAAAGTILDLVLERFPADRAVVRVRKFVLENVGHVEVQMERRRGA